MHVYAPNRQSLPPKDGSGKQISQLLRNAIAGAPLQSQPNSQKQHTRRRGDPTPIDVMPFVSDCGPTAPGIKAGALKGGAAAGTSSSGIADRCASDFQSDLEQIAELTAKIAEQPDCVTLWIQRGLFQMNLKRYHAAAADFSAAIQLAPRLAQAYYKRSQAYYMLGKEEQAARDRQLAKQLFTGERWT